MCPVSEIFAHLIMLEEKEQADRFDQFVLMLHANPMSDQQARNQYMRAIEPKNMVAQRVGSMETDLDQLRRLKGELAAE